MTRDLIVLLVHAVVTVAVVLAFVGLFAFVLVLTDRGRHDA